MACMYKPANKDELHELVANPEICLGDIDTSLITDMSELFNGVYNREDFSGIENWDTSQVTDMSGMFVGMGNFNQPIGNWNTSRVTDMSKMFYRGKNFTYVIRK